MRRRPAPTPIRAAPIRGSSMPDSIRAARRARTRRGCRPAARRSAARCGSTRRRRSARYRPAPGPWRAARARATSTSSASRLHGCASRSAGTSTSRTTPGSSTSIATIPAAWSTSRALDPAHAASPGHTLRATSGGCPPRPANRGWTAAWSASASRSCDEGRGLHERMIDRPQPRRRGGPVRDRREPERDRARHAARRIRVDPHAQLEPPRLGRDLARERLADDHDGIASPTPRAAAAIRSSTSAPRAAAAPSRRRRAACPPLPPGSPRRSRLGLARRRIGARGAHRARHLAARTGCQSPTAGSPRRRSATSSAAIAIAISSGVSAPMSRPIGARSRAQRASPRRRASPAPRGAA